MADEILVKVEARHIEHGHRNDRARCPLALALRDGHCKGWKTVSVGRGGIYLLWDHQAISSDWVHSPDSLSFLTLFDSGEKVAAAMLAGAHPEGFLIKRRR